eukprot:c21055_g2_i2 orf=575-1774(+)
MSVLGPLGISLSVVFAGFILVLLAEIFFIFYNRRGQEMDRSIECGLHREGEEQLNPISAHSLELFSLFCWKRTPRNDAFEGNIVAEELMAGSNGSCNSEVEETIVLTALGELQRSPLMHSDLVAKLFPLQGDMEDEDLLTLGGLLGPPRLLFTIKEESKDDLDSEDGRSKNGRSRKTSRASSEFLPQIDLGTITPLETPFVTPLSSPSSTATHHSPPLAFGALPVKLATLTSAFIPSSLDILVDESSSFSSSSSETITPAVPSSPPSRRCLSPLIEQTSSFSSLAKSSFQIPLLERRRSSARASGIPVEACLEAPDSPTGFLNQYHAHPLGSPFRFKDLMEGTPIHGFSASNAFPDSSPVASPSDESEHASDFSTTPSRSWPPSPPTPPLRSALSSPCF